MQDDVPKGPFGCGSKLKRRGYAGFGPCFPLPGQPILEFRFSEFATANSLVGLPWQHGHAVPPQVDPYPQIPAQGVGIQNHSDGRAIPDLANATLGSGEESQVFRPCPKTKTKTNAWCPVDFPGQHGGSLFKQEAKQFHMHTVC